MKTPTNSPKERFTFLRLWDWTRRRRHDLGDCSGATAVEFALLLPVFFAIVFGVMEFGRVLYTTHTLDNAVREGVRYAMVHGAASPNPALSADIEAVVKSRAAPLDPAKVVVLPVSFEPNNRPDSTVMVQVRYDFDFLLPVPLGPVTLTSASRMIIAY